jgi:hypothetical protein
MIVMLMYDLIVTGVAWTVIKLFTRLVVPPLWVMAIYVAALLSSQMWWATRTEKKQLKEAVADGSSEGFRISRAWKWSAGLFIGSLGILTLVFSRWAYQAGYGGHYIDYHDVWAWTAATFGIAVTTRALYLWHRAHFWHQGDGRALKSVLPAIWFTGSTIFSIGLFAGIAHFIVHEDLFYNIRCFASETPGGLALLAVWWILSRWSISREAARHRRDISATNKAA